jgi:transposase
MLQSIRKVCASLNHPYSTVLYTINRFKETNSNMDRRGRGNFQSLSSSDKRFIKILSKRDRTKTLPFLTEEFNIARKKTCSQSTVRRCLLDWGLKGRVAAKKPLLRKPNVAKRLAFEKDHVTWTNEQWSQVLFSDESKFEIFGNKRRLFVRRFEGERYSKYCLQPTVKHGGGSIMVWGAISSKGALPLKRIEGKMDMKVTFCQTRSSLQPKRLIYLINFPFYQVYHQILIRHVIPGGKRLLGRGFTFQEDNDPKYAFKLCRGYLERKENAGV